MFNSCAKLLFGKSWKLTRKSRIPEKKLRFIIQQIMANGLRHSRGPSRSTIWPLHTLSFYRGSVLQKPSKKLQVNRVFPVSPFFLGSWWRTDWFECYKLFDTLTLWNKQWYHCRKWQSSKSLNVYCVVKFVHKNIRSLNFYVEVV